MKTMEKHPLIMILIGIFGISLSSILVRYSSAPASVTAAFRMLWTVLLMTPMIICKPDIHREIFQMNKGQIMLCLISGFFLALHFWLWFESLHNTSVASSTTIVCTEVIWVSIGYCTIMKGRLSGKAVISIAVTLIGSMIVAFSDSHAGGFHLYGDLLALLAAIAVAVYTLIGRHMRKSVSTNAYTYLVYCACAIVLIVLSAMQKQQLFSYGSNAVVIGLLLAIFSTLLGHSIFSWCLKYFSPSFVSASKLTEPIAAAILAGILFGEIPSWIAIIGGMLILGGVFAYSRIERP